MSKLICNLSDYYKPNTTSEKVIIPANDYNPNTPNCLCCYSKTTTDPSNLIHTSNPTPHQNLRTTIVSIQKKQTQTESETQISNSNMTQKPQITNVIDGINETVN